MKPIERTVLSKTKTFINARTKLLQSCNKEEVQAIRFIEHEISLMMQKEAQPPFEVPPFEVSHFHTNERNTAVRNTASNTMQPSPVRIRIANSPDPIIASSPQEVSEEQSEDDVDEGIKNK